VTGTAVHRTVTDVGPGVTASITGAACGVVDGVTGDENVENGPVPFRLVASTANR
jgi:hypothetical protein